MKYIVSLVLFIHVATIAYAQENVITGRVLSNNKALAGATVYVKNGNINTATNEKGQYTLTNITNGRVVIVASLVGYENLEKTVTITNGINTIDFILKENNTELDAVVVSTRRETGYLAKEQSAATFGSRSLKDLPQSVSVITQEVLIDQQVRALGDLVRNDPSTIVSNPPGFNETINVRGFNLDNSSSYRRENLIFQNQVQSPFENKAAVEIVKGPAAIRYGFTPPGGIINYVIKRPTKNPYAFVQTFGDSNGSFGIHGDFGGTTSEKFGYRINTVVAEEAAYVNHVSGPRHMFSALFEWKPVEKLTIDFEGEYQYRELEQQAVISLNSFSNNLNNEQKQQILKDFNPKTFLGQEWSTYPTRNFIGSIGAKYNFNDNWKIEGRIQKMNLIRDQKAAGIVTRSLQANGDFQSQIFYNPAQVRDPISTEAFVNGKFNTSIIKHNLSTGFAYSRNPLKFSQTNAVFPIGVSNIFNPASLPFPPAALGGPTIEALVITQKAAFITDFIEISEKLEVLAALRYTQQRNEDVFNDDEIFRESYKDGQLSSNFGLIYKPLRALSIYGSYATGVTDGEQVPEEASNFGQEVFLDPQETEQIELGFKAEIFKRALLTGAIFDIKQPLALIDENNIFKYGGTQRHRGVELTLGGNITNNLRAVIGGLYLNAEVDDNSQPSIDGQRPASVPKFQGNIYLDYNLAFAKGLSVNTGVFHTGDRFADNSGSFKVDGYTRLDLGARYGFYVMGKEVTARFNVRNITNKQFIEGLAFGQFTFGAPRTGIFSLAVIF